MTEDDASAALLVMLLFDNRRPDWPAARVEAWTRAIQQCADPGAASDASDALVADHDPRDWSLHRWREAYQSALRRRESRRQIAAPAEEIIPLSEYMRRLGLRAAVGDTEAAAEHARFTRHRHLFDAQFPAPQETL